jgi:REP element-mobilizing transposase RayT
MSIYNKNRHAYYKLTYHLVEVTKYRTQMYILGYDDKIERNHNITV